MPRLSTLVFSLCTLLCFACTEPVTTVGQEGPLAEGAAGSGKEDGLTTAEQEAIRAHGAAVVMQAELCEVDALLESPRSYNVFVTGDYTAGYSDAEGKIASGGDVSLAHYSVALHDVGGWAVVADGTVTTQDTAIHGSVAAGGQVRLNNSGLYSDDDASITRRHLIDWDAAGSGITRASQLLAQHELTGATRTSGNSVLLTGYREDLNLFEVSGTTISSADRLDIDVPPGAAVVINVTGGAIHFGDFAVFPESIDSSTILFNAAEATEVRIEAFAFTGSLLAPNAAVDFDNGQFNGVLLAGALVGDGMDDGQPDGQFNHRPYGVYLCEYVTRASDDLCLADDLLGTAMEYNVFLTGDYVAGYSDAEGKVAAGGDVDVWHYSVALQNPNGNALVAGGDVALADAAVQGDIVAGGRVTMNNSGLYPTDGSRGQTLRGTVLDFEEVGRNLAMASELLGGLEPNGNTSVWGSEITLSGNDQALNVFLVSGSAVSSASYFSISVPSSSDVVINLSGSSIEFSNFGIFPTNIDASRVLFNAPDATDIRIEAFAFSGSLLAPYAAVDFDNGQFNGTLMARELEGDGMDDDQSDGQFNHRPFSSVYCE